MSLSIANEILIDYDTREEAIEVAERLSINRYTEPNGELLYIFEDRSKLYFKKGSWGLL